MNFAAIKARCWKMIDDNATTPKEVDDTLMGELINEAIKDLADNLNIQKKATPTFTAGVADLPADYMAPVAVYYSDDRVTEINSVLDKLDDDEDIRQFLILNNTEIRVYGSYATATPPGAPTVADASVAGNPDGTYLCKVTYVNSRSVETAGGTASSEVTVTDSKIAWSDIAVDSTGEAVARKLYRTKDGGSTYFYVAAISDNTTTTYIDNVADADLTAQLDPNTVTLWYKAYPAALVETTDVPTELPEKIHKLIPIYVKAQYMLQRGQHDEYSRLMSIWESEAKPSTAKTARDIKNVNQGLLKSPW